MRAYEDVPTTMLPSFPVATMSFGVIDTLEHPAPILGSALNAHIGHYTVGQILTGTAFAVGAVLAGVYVARKGYEWATGTGN